MALTIKSHNGTDYGSIVGGSKPKPTEWNGIPLHGKQAIRIKGYDSYLGSPNIIQKSGIWVPNYTDNIYQAAIVADASIPAFLEPIALLPRALEFISWEEVQAMTTKG